MMLPPIRPNRSSMSCGARTSMCSTRPRGSGANRRALDHAARVGLALGRPTSPRASSYGPYCVNAEHQVLARRARALPARARSGTPPRRRGARTSGRTSRRPRRARGTRSRARPPIEPAVDVAVLVPGRERRELRERHVHLHRAAARAVPLDVAHDARRGAGPRRRGRGRSCIGCALETTRLRADQRAVERARRRPRGRSR